MHTSGTDARTPRPDPDTATLTVFRYRYSVDASPGHVAVLDVPADAQSIAVSDDLRLGRAHAARDAGWGYTALPSLRAGVIRWHEGSADVRIEIDAGTLSVRAALERLGPPAFVLGSHPRDAGLAYFSVMREAARATLSVNGIVIAGEPFLHRGYEPWIGVARRSAAVQLAETLVERGLEDGSASTSFG